MPVFARLPERIELDLAEARLVLAGLDHGALSATGDDLEIIDAAIVVITTKLWPELGDLLSEGDA